MSLRKVLWANSNLMASMATQQVENDRVPDDVAGLSAVSCWPLLGGSKWNLYYGTCEAYRKFICVCSRRPFCRSVKAHYAFAACTAGNAGMTHCIAGAAATFSICLECMQALLHFVTPAAGSMSKGSKCCNAQLSTVQLLLKS